MKKKNLQISKLEKYDGKFYEPKPVTKKSYYAIVQVVEKVKVEGKKEPQNVTKEFVVDVEGKFPLQARKLAESEAKLIGGKVLSLHAYN